MIYTSYFGSKKWNYSNGISIARYEPQWYKGFRCEELYPPDEILKLYKAGRINERTYTSLYYEQVLDRLNPDRMYSLLQGMILLCYEKPGQFCHRYIVAKWFREFDYPVFELE